MSKITIKELAERLNLSISTVSRALSDSYETSEETKKRVKALADELGYRPDVYASNLRSKKSRTIGVIIPEITNSFFSLAINGIEEVARQNGYHVLIYLSHEDYEQEASVARLLLDGRVDGILMSVGCATTNTAHIEAFNKRGIPVVLFDRICDGLNTLKVITDDYNSGYKSAQHLIEQGCEKLAYLSLSKHLSIDQRRKSGFIDAANQYNTAFEIICCSPDEEENIRILSELLSSTNKPDGIFASVEKLGITLYQVCQELNMQIPSQLKIISFSNIKIAPLLQPPLTTITQPAFEIGRKASAALFRALKNNFLFVENEEVIVPSELVVRESTRA